MADAGKLPGWVVAIAPVDKLAKVRDSTPIKAEVWVGEGLVLINPRVVDGFVKFPLGFVESWGEIQTDGGRVKVPNMGVAWVLDGEFPTC